MSSRDRISNKEMRRAIERDEVADFFHRATDWTKAHLENVIVGGVILIVVAFVIPFYLSSRSTRMGKASMMIGDAHRVYQQALGQNPLKEGKDALNQAASKYQEIVTAYGGGEAEMEAQLGLANCDFALGKLDQADSAYKEFVTKHASHPLAPLALAGQGACQEGKGAFKQAAEIYASVAARFPDAPNKGLSLLDAARNYAAAGDKAKAKEILKAAIDGKSLPEGLVAQAKAKLEAL